VNPKLQQYVVNSLNVSGSLHESARNTYLPALSHPEWKRLLHWLDGTGLTLTYWQHLKDVGEDGLVPSQYRAHLEQNLQDHRLRIEAMISEFEAINFSLEAAGVPYAVLKGFALVPQYSPHIFLRTTYDYDYLLPRESIEGAEKALKAAGYVRKKDPEEHPRVYFHAAHPPHTPSSRNELYSRALPRTIELHYLFWDADPVKIPLNLSADPMAQLGGRRIRVLSREAGSSWPGRPVQFYTLAEHDEVIFQVLHAFRHILRGWCRLCSLLDIAYFLDHRASDTTFWEQFVERLKPSRELAEIVGVVFSLAAGLFGATIPSPVIAQITRNLRRSLAVWIEHYGKNSALRNFSDNKFSLFLHREFIYDDVTWRQITRSRLFPIRRPKEAAHAADRSRRARLTRKWKQALYVSQRLKHHALSTIQYGLEARRWQRVRSGHE
jgi:hypothetical protein